MEKTKKRRILEISILVVAFLALAILVFSNEKIPFPEEFQPIEYNDGLTAEQEAEIQRELQRLEAQEWCEANPLQCKG